MAAKTEGKSVKEIFENMDYGSVKESFDLAKAWIERHGLKIPKTPEEIENAIQNSEKQSKPWAAVSASEKAKLLNKLAADIEKHTTLICQVELFVRQVLTKDTKNKSISLITDYLRYYAGWTYLIKNHLTDYKPYGVCAAYVSESTPLAMFGATLAPILASGNAIILGVHSTIIPIACLIMELCKNAGFPEGIVSVIDVPNIDIFMSHKLIKKITFIGNLLDKTTNDIQAINNKHLTTFHLEKSSATVFDSADIDSAVDCIVESGWTNKGMFGINKLYVQESVYNEFVNRMKAKILKLNVGYPASSAEKTVDVIIPNEIFPDNIKVDYINKIPIQFGYKTFGGNVLSDEENSTILSILAFRTTNEAVALCNNSRFGSATSVWTENFNLANEVSFKLKSSIVWLNTHGYINANTAFSPIKASGQGCFGGKEGLLEYMTYNKPPEFKPAVMKTTTTESHLPNASNNKRLTLYYGGSFKKSESGLTDGDNEYLNKKDIRNCVEIAKKSYETWSKINLKVRAQNLLKLADSSFEAINKLENFLFQDSGNYFSQDSEAWKNLRRILVESLKIKNTALVEKWVESLREWAVLVDSKYSSIQKGNPELKTIKEPLGIITIDVQSDSDFICLKLLISALIFGNAVILVNYANDLEEFLFELCKIIPLSGITAGVFNVIFNPNAVVVNTLLTHREISTYFKTETKQTTFKQMQNIKYFKNVNCNSFDILNLVTSTKCIWSSVGESFL